VRGEDDSASLGRLGVHCLPELAASAGVHARRRLVEDEQLRIGQQREGEPQPLLLTARALPHLACHETVQPRPAHDVVDTRVRVVQGGDSPHRLSHAEVAQQATGLQDGRHLPGNHGAARRGAQHLDRARRGWHQAQRDVERGCLAGTVRAEERDDLAGRDLDVDTVDRHDGLVPGATRVLLAPCGDAHSGRGHDHMITDRAHEVNTLHMKPRDAACLA